MHRRVVAMARRQNPVRQHFERLGLNATGEKPIPNGPYFAPLNHGLSFLLLRTGFGTKWPWSIEASGFRVINSRANSYIAARLRAS
jgi:hypothetical protein